MFDTTRFRRYGVALGAAAITALGVGGIAVAQSTKQAPKPAQQSATVAEPTGGPDKDNVQSGDQTTPDTAKSASDTAKSEAPGQESSEAPGQETETKANSDGPGGHADEPGNPNADYQFQGNQ